MSRIVNSSITNAKTYFEVDGTAYDTQVQLDTNTVQPTVVGSAKCIGTSDADTINKVGCGSLGPNFGNRMVESLTQNAKALTSGTWAYQAAAKYIVMRSSITIAGVSNLFLRSGANYQSGMRAINSVTALRDPGTAAALRANYFNPLGVTRQVTNWTTDPTASNDFAAMGAEDAPTISKPGELTYKDGSSPPENADYSARTLW
jgi:hypothetical protein